MTVRRRILFAALALAVVGTLVVLFWPAGPKDTTPKLEFTLLGYTNGATNRMLTESKLARVTLRNQGKYPVTVSYYKVLVESGSFESPRTIAGLQTNLATGCSCTLLPPVFATYQLGNQTVEVGSTASRWRLKCTVERRTLSNSLRRAVQKLPVIGRHIDSPPGYEVYSDFFEQ